MKLYLLSQDKVDGWDTFDSAVVSAESEGEARLTHPQGINRWKYPSDAWVLIDDISHIYVEYLGETNISAGVVCASFNAG